MNLEDIAQLSGGIRNHLKNCIKACPWLSPETKDGLTELVLHGLLRDLLESQCDFSFESSTVITALFSWGIAESPFYEFAYSGGTLVSVEIKRAQEVHPIIHEWWDEVTRTIPPAIIPTLIPTAISPRPILSSRQYQHYAHGDEGRGMLIEELLDESTLEFVRKQAAKRNDGK